MSYQLKIHYKGGAGTIVTYDTMHQVHERLANIARLIDTGSAVLHNIEITPIKDKNPRVSRKATYRRPGKTRLRLTNTT